MKAGDLVAHKDGDPKREGVLVRSGPAPSAPQWYAVRWHGDDDLTYHSGDDLVVRESRSWYISYANSDDENGPREMSDPLDADELTRKVMEMLEIAAAIDLAVNDHDDECDCERVWTLIILDQLERLANAVLAGKSVTLEAPQAPPIYVDRADIPVEVTA